MVQEIQAMKMEAERKILQQKQTYEDKLRNLEGTLVRGRGMGGALHAASMHIGQPN